MCAVARGYLARRRARPKMEHLKLTRLRVEEAPTNLVAPEAAKHKTPARLGMKAKLFYWCYWRVPLLIPIDWSGRQRDGFWRVTHWARGPRACLVAATRKGRSERSRVRVGAGGTLAEECMERCRKLSRVLHAGAEANSKPEPNSSKSILQCTVRAKKNTHNYSILLLIYVQ